MTDGGFHSWRRHCQYFYLAFVLFFAMLSLFLCLVVVSGYYENNIAELVSRKSCNIVYFDYGSWIE